MITLIYDDYEPDGIFGKFIFDGLLGDGKTPFCNTLTHAFKQPDGSYLPAVMPGVYVCVRGIHELEDPKNPDKVIPIESFEITGVSGHSGIIFHPGNWNKDSEGCQLLGQSRIESSLGRMITKSAATFKAFMQQLSGFDNFYLEVKDARLDKEGS